MYSSEGCRCLSEGAVCREGCSWTQGQSLKLRVNLPSRAHELPARWVPGSDRGPTPRRGHAPVATFSAGALLDTEGVGRVLKYGQRTSRPPGWVQKATTFFLALFGDEMSGPLTVLGRRTKNIVQRPDDIEWNVALDHAIVYGVDDPDRVSDLGRTVSL